MNKPFRKRVFTSLAVFLAALLLTLVSVGYQRTGPEYGFLRNECEPDCKEFRLKGGWPFAYVYDQTGISIIGALGIEDEFRGFPFAVNITCYAIILGIFVWWSQKKVRRKFHDDEQR